MFAQVSRIKLLLPGSFNPVHHGHVAVLQKAAEVQQLPASSMNDGTSVFEISMTNADKGAIDGEELATRLQGFADIGASVVVTADHPTFVSKAQVRRDAGKQTPWIRWWVTKFVSLIKSNDSVDVCVFVSDASFCRDEASGWGMTLHCESSTQSTTSTHRWRA